MTPEQMDDAITRFCQGHSVTDISAFYAVRRSAIEDLLRRTMFHLMQRREPVPKEPEGVLPDRELQALVHHAAHSRITSIRRSDADRTLALVLACRSEADYAAAKALAEEAFALVSKDPRGELKADEHGVLHRVPWVLTDAH